MTSFEPYPVSQTPYVPKRRSDTSDVVATCTLIGLYFGGFLIVAYMSRHWSNATDSCTGQTCNFDYIFWAIILTDLVGGFVLLSTSITGIVLMACQRVAFWAPLLGIVIQIILVLSSLIALDAVAE